MLIPHVMDNPTHTMREVATWLLKEHEGRCSEIATAGFSVGGVEQKNGRVNEVAKGASPLLTHSSASESGVEPSILDLRAHL